MSKAKDSALEKYPLIPNDDKEGLEALKYVGMECECASVYNEVQEAKQAYFIEGYHQAEKDLELTWKDIKTIDKLLNQCVDCSNPYQEVLKRFKDYKKREWEQFNFN